MEKIKSLWEIDEEHQELFYNGQQIINLDFSLQQIGIKNEDEIIVVSDFNIYSLFCTMWT
jgi:hypothetical protein